MAGPQETNPYQPPRASALASELGRAPPGFVDQTILVLILTGLLGVQLTAGALNALLCITFNFIEAEPERVDTLIQLSGTLASAQNGLYYVTLLPFAIFLVRANKNARVTSGAELEFTPASMVWWFAVPFLNLVRPFQAVRAVWEASAPSSGDLSSKQGVLVLWWTFWLATLFISRLSGLLVKSAEPEFQNVISSLTNALAAGLAAAALLMIRALHERQRRCAAELAPT